MNPISVGTQSRSCDGDGLDVNVFAAVESEVELRAVLDSQPFNSQVGAHEEPDCLQISTIATRLASRTQLGAQI